MTSRLRRLTLAVLLGASFLTFLRALDLAIATAWRCAQ